ncbi:GNAT family N-acetyltransferase [Paenibacillus sp. 453mf]|uniref:GNAT family N-acetyltransferase n=1 Tax=Paenibacillus sp. 453mf TaxID=1761874 RepID=UPI0008E6D9F2|nr:GNAT family N-acetyltransferase [Paenibacillus sp. 453mf]SFS47105.1 Acetyltransferase (GNAT) domain-containing protein [Paenibacillus sp. 453mf]
MLVSIKDRINDVIVQELIGYSTLPEESHIQAALAMYKNNDSTELLGFEDEGQLVALIGIEQDGNKVMIKHLAVLPENREKGYGRGIISEMISSVQPETVIAETDEEAVDFYRNVGFVVYSLGEKYPGVERFRCVFETEEEE